MTILTFLGLSLAAGLSAFIQLALLYQHAPGPVLRSTVAICFLVGEVMSLIILERSGAVHTAQITAAADLIPAALSGSVMSRFAHARINGPALRMAVLIFSIASGAILVLKG